MTDESPARPPHIPDYVLLKRIGQGAYGDVWLARGVTGLFRAIKVVWRDRFGAAGPYEREFAGLKRFAAISLAAPRQMALLHMGRDDAAGYFYYVMELADDVVAGSEIDPSSYHPCTLKELATRRGPLTAPEVVALGIDLAGGLSELHRHGLVHRDIKPSNVILANGVPKLADIGLVTAAANDVSLVGTLGYLAPEGPGTPAADVYSLGKVLYELVTGLDRHDYPRLPADLARRNDGPAFFELNEIIIRACAPDPGERFGSAEAVLEELRLLQAGQSVQRLRQAERNARRLGRLALGAAVVLVAALVGLAWQQHAARLERERTARENRLRYGRDISLAQLDLLWGDLRSARQRLADWSPRDGAARSVIPGFEWASLEHRAVGDPSITLAGTNDFTRADISPDGQYAAAASSTNGLTIWEVAGRSVIRTEPGMGLAGFTADGKSIVAHAKGGGTWRVPIDPGQPPEKLFAVALTQLSPDRTQAWGRAGEENSQDQPFILQGLDLRSGRALPRLEFAPSPDYNRVWFWAMAPGQWLAVERVRSGGQQQMRRLEVWSLPSKELVYSEQPTNTIRHLRFSNQGALLACSFSESARVRVLNTATWREQWHAGVHEGTVFGLAFSPDDRWLATAGHDRTVCILDAWTGAEHSRLIGHHSEVRRVAWSRDGRSLVSAGFDGEVRVWGEPFLHFADAAPGFCHDFGGNVDFVRDDRDLAVTGGDGTVVILDAQTLRPQQSLDGAFKPLGVDHAGRYVTASRDWTLQYRNPETYALEREGGRLMPGDEEGDFASLAGRGEWLVAGSYEGTLQFTPLTAGEPEVRRNFTSQVESIAACSSQPLVAVGYEQGTIEAWTLPPGDAPAWTESIPHEATALAWSPDGTRLAVGDDRGSLWVLDLKDHRRLGPFPGPARELRGLWFTRDGSQLVSGDASGQIRFRRASDWREEPIPIQLRRFAGVDGDRRIVTLAGSRDGRHLAILQQNGVVSVFHGESTIGSSR